MCRAGEQLEIEIMLMRVGTASRNQLQAKLLTLYSLNIPLQPTHHACFPLVMAYTYALLVLHRSQLTPMHCLLSISNGFHPPNACSSLVTAHIHAFLVYGHHLLIFICGQMYLPTASTTYYLIWITITPHKTRFY